jgi:uncharacterized protein
MTNCSNRPLRNCHDNPSGQLLLGIRQFNSREWFECHETLELLWMKEEGELRPFYQGLIQLAIAQLHWRNNNFNGAVALLASGAGYLKQVSSPCQWVDLAGLIQQTEALQTTLQQLGAEQMSSLDQHFLLKIQTISV